MENEWLEIAYINYDKAIMHGQIQERDGRISNERTIEQVLTQEQVRQVEDLNAEREMRKLLRSFIDSWEYSICKRGIYYTTSAYHDDLDYHYVVDFEKPDVHAQFQAFLKNVEAVGAKKGMKELKQQFRGLRELLA